MHWLFLRYKRKKPAGYRRTAFLVEVSSGFELSSLHIPNLAPVAKNAVFAYPSGIFRAGKIQENQNFVTLLVTLLTNLPV